MYHNTTANTHICKTGRQRSAGVGGHVGVGGAAAVHRCCVQQICRNEYSSSFIRCMAGFRFCAVLYMQNTTVRAKKLKKSDGAKIHCFKKMVKCFKIFVGYKLAAGWVDRKWSKCTIYTPWSEWSKPSVKKNQLEPSKNNPDLTLAGVNIAHFDPQHNPESHSVPFSTTTQSLYVGVKYE